MASTIDQPRSKWPSIHNQNSKVWNISGHHLWITSFQQRFLWPINGDMNESCAIVTEPHWYTHHKCCHLRPTHYYKLYMFHTIPHMNHYFSAVAFVSHMVKFGCVVSFYTDSNILKNIVLERRDGCKITCQQSYHVRLGYLHINVISHRWHHYCRGNGIKKLIFLMRVHLLPKKITWVFLKSAGFCRGRA